MLLLENFLRLILGDDQVIGSVWVNFDGTEFAGGDLVLEEYIELSVGKTANKLAC